MIVRVLPVAAVTLLLAACGGASSSDSTSASASTSAASAATGLPDDALVMYAFQDSSVPPPYHRSVTLTVTKEQAHIVIDSYGDVLADERVATPAAAWNELGATIDSLTGLTVANSAEGCTGGTSISLTVTSGGQELVTLDPEFCGGANAELEAPIAAWIAPARDLFPPTSELAPEGE